MANILMILEMFGLFTSLFVLMLIGLGPALGLMSLGSKRVIYAFGLAPAIGFAILVLIGFPLVRYVAPVSDWAWPITIGLTVVSCLLVYVDWRQHRGDYEILRHWRSVLGLVSLFLVGYLILSVPLLNGMSYLVFRANPSDAFNYISMAETTRVVPWNILMRGAEFSSNNLAGLTQLAASSPTALFSARFIELPLALNKMVIFAWVAELARMPVYQFYYAHHLLAFALAFPALLVIGDQLNLPSVLKYLAPAAITLGFWAKFVLETDAGYEISVLPLMVLVIFAWIEFERESKRVLSRSRFLLAMACAAIVVLYFPLVPVLVLAFGAYYGLGIAQKLKPISSLALHSLTIALIVSVFLISGQFDFVFQNALYLITHAGGESRFSPIVLNLIKTDGLAAIWGLSSSILLSSSPGILRWPLGQIAEVIGIFLTASLGVNFLYVVRKSSNPAERIIFALLAAGGILALVSILLGNRRASGKAFTYLYPYLLLAVLVYPRYYWDRLLQPMARNFSLALISGWLVVQVGIGIYLPLNAIATDSLDRIMNGEAISRVLKHGREYDLSPIMSYLDSHPPKHLLVAIPKDENWAFTSEETWPFAFYSMFVFNRYPVHFQSGLIVDNSLNTSNVWLGSLTDTPDYAVILNEVDYIGSEGLGTKVAQTGDLTLYQLSPASFTALLKHEDLFKQRESERSCAQGNCLVP